MSYQNREIYQNKLEAIVKLAERYQDRVDDKEWPELRALLKTFSEFARSYIELIDRMPEELGRPQFALNRGVDKLLNEWNALSRACEQVDEQVDGVKIPYKGLSANLKEARTKLQGYCERWNNKSASFEKLGNPVVYFEKVYRISRSLYAPDRPVISIPLTDYIPDDNAFSGNGQRWSALAHEFGHHLYWNALIDLQVAEEMRVNLRESVIEAVVSAKEDKKAKGGQRIQQAQMAVDRARVWGQWLEEVFADVCGTLLDGPIYVLSAQNLAADRARVADDLTLGDHQYPIPYLRPFIALYTLRKMAESSQSEDFRKALQGETGLLERFDQRWREWCGDKIGQKHYLDTMLTLKELDEDITLVVDTILTGKYWPKTKLIERLGFYGKETMPSDLELFKDLDNLPALAEASVPALIPVPPVDDEIPETLKMFWLYLKSKVSNTDEQSLTYWSLLLSLELSDIHFHVPNHGCGVHPLSSSYWPYRSYPSERHCHNPFTGQISYC